MHYFDHNATSPLHPAARQAWLEASEKFIGNPSSPHRVGARADAALGEAREKLAAMLGCHALDMVWTSGATESANLALHHFAHSLDAAAEMWVSAIEHPCVLEAARHYFGQRLRLIPVTRDGVVDVAWLRRELAANPASRSRRREKADAPARSVRPPPYVVGSGRPGAVAVMAANNETGVLQPWREVLALCRQRGVPFFCDAVQWMGKLPARGLGECDFVSGSAHKFGGPRGVGFLKCPAKGRVEPLLRGGPQEEGRRAGTENVPGVLAMVVALTARETRSQESGVRSQKLQEAFEQRLLVALPDAEIVGAGADRLWNTVCALMPAADCRQRWVVKLDKAGCAVSTGSACASGKEAPSHVLAAMGRSPAEAARVLRFSSGWETTQTDWDALLAALTRVNVAVQSARGSGKA